jgi:hypothetical protein
MLKILCTIALLLLGSAQTAHAVLAGVGPNHPISGFPLWYQDTNGLALEMCLDNNALLCGFDPPIAGNQFSQDIGFGGKRSGGPVKPP